MMGIFVTWATEDKLNPLDASLLLLTNLWTIYFELEM